MNQSVFSPRLAVLALVSASTAVGALEPDRALTQYVSRTWGLADGLPSTAITAFAETADGDLWIGTGEGLVRFDGFDFEVYDRTNTEAMVVSEVRLLALHPSGDLYVGVAFGGIVRCRARRCVALGPTDRDVGGLQIASDGAVWASMQDGSLWRLAGDAMEPVDGFDGGVGPLPALVIDPRGRLWRYHPNGALVVVDPATAEVRRGAELGWGGGELQDFDWLADGSLLLVSPSEVLRCPGDALDRCARVFGPLPNITRLEVDRAGSIWVATQGEAGLIRLAAGREDRLTVATGLVGRRVWDLHEDRSGNIWVGTWDNGLQRLSAGTFVPVGAPEGMPEERVRVVLVGADGSVWAGTDAGLVSWVPEGAAGATGWPGFSPGRWRRSLVPAAGGGIRFVNSLADGGDGAILAGGLDGLFRVDREREQRWWPSGLPAAASVQSIRPDGEGGWWLGLGLAGVPGRAYRLSAQGVATPVPDVAGLVYAFARDREQRWWIASQQGAFRQTDAGFAPFTVGSRGAVDVLFAAATDQRGDLWLGGLDRGLTRVRIDGPRPAGVASASDAPLGLATLTTRDGLPNDSVHAVVDDGLGSLWVSSGRGVWRVALDDLDRYLVDRTSRLVGRLFDESDGLRTRATSGGSQPAGFRDPHGRLWFATQRGLVVVDPRRVEPLVAPPARLEAVTVDGEPVPVDGRLALPPGRHRVEVAWTALHLTAPERLRFRHRLHGLDADWIQAGTRRRAEYPAVPAGSYRFAVEATLDGEDWGVAAFLAVAGLAGGAVRWRYARRAARERETRDELERLVGFGRDVTGVLDPQVIAARLLDAIERRFGAVQVLLLAQREGRQPLLLGSAASRLDADRVASWVPLLATFDAAAETPTPGSPAAASAPSLARELGEAGLAIAAPIASGGVTFGLIALGPLPAQRRYLPRDLAHLGGLGAAVAAALEGAWQAQEAVRWRDLSEARREWSELDVVGRLVFAAVARAGYERPPDLEAVRATLGDLLAQPTPGSPAAGRPADPVAAAIERLCRLGALSPHPDGSLRIERDRWLLLPEVGQPLAELARGSTGRIGPYRLLERLGVGGMGEVYQAVDVHNGAEAAVKLLYPAETLDHEARSRFEREAELVARIDHPNVVRLLARGEHEGRLYLAMELLAGETLAERLQRGPLGAGAVVELARQLAAGLAALHAQGVVHRDLKPGNVMCVPDGRHVLLDLGLARALGASTLTRAQTVLGTLPYMAPEALRGEALDPRADLWSLGVVLHEALTGKLPWPAGDTLQLALAVAAASTPPVLTLPLATPPPLAALLADLLAPRREERLTTGDEVLARLAPTVQ